MPMIDTLLKTLELKDEKRTGWQLRNVEDPESVADHSWGVALLILIYGETEEINTDKALKMALVHDLAEVETGDLPTRAVDVEQEISDEEKELKEREAISGISKDLNRHEIRHLWKEYNRKKSSEANFVKDMDMIEMCLQALKYEKEERYDPEKDNENFKEYENMDEFFATTQPRLNTETGEELFKKIKSRYEKAKR